MFMSKTVLLWDLKKEYNSSFNSKVEKRVQQNKNIYRLTIHLS